MICIAPKSQRESGRIGKAKYYQGYRWHAVLNEAVYARPHKKKVLHILKYASYLVEITNIVCYWLH